MSEINNKSKASKILEDRRRVLKEIEEREKKEQEKQKAALDNLINLILNVFEGSNKDSKNKTSAHLLVWQVRILMNEAEKISCSVATSKDDDTCYYSTTSVVGNFGKSEDNKNLIGAMSILEAVETTKNIFNGVYDYFVNTGGYFASQYENVITIKML